jgi:methionyl-tRNA formyltransferase
MRLVLLASGAFAAPTIRWLAESEHGIALVVTQPARGSGRGRRTTPTPVKVLADERGLPVVEVENVNTREFIEKVRSLDAPLMLAIAFGQKLGPEFLAATSGGAINLHASLLPKYRGAAPINWAVVRGERETGCTVFRIVSRMDAGPILAKSSTPIEPDETAGELHDRLADLGVQTVRDALALFAGGVNPPGTPQDEAQTTLAPKLKKPDGFIDFARPARSIVDLIRGMTPWPGATARFVAASGRSEVVTIIRIHPSPDSAAPDTPLPPPLASGDTGELQPGSIDDRLLVAVGDGFVRIVEIKPASGRTMSWTDFVNGRHLLLGDRFESPA